MKNVMYSLKGCLMLALLSSLAGCVIDPIQFESKDEIKGAPEWVNTGSILLHTKDGRKFYGVSSAPPSGDLALQRSIADDGAMGEILLLLTNFLEMAASSYISLDYPSNLDVSDEDVTSRLDEELARRAKEDLDKQVDDAIARHLKDSVSPQFKDEIIRSVKESNVRQNKEAVTNQSDFLRQLDELIALKIREVVSRQLKLHLKEHLLVIRNLGSWRDPKTSYIWAISELDLRNVKSTLAGITDMNKDLKQYVEINAENIFDNTGKGKSGFNPFSVK
jgi:hypothetical protein